MAWKSFDVKSFKRKGMMKSMKDRDKKFDWKNLKSEDD